jgi:hypothetical protein
MARLFGERYLIAEAVGAGVVMAVVIVLSVSFGQPVVILSGGSSEILPAFIPGTEPGVNLSEECPLCGTAGVFQVTFAVGLHASLSGMFHATDPISVDIANEPGGVSIVQCSLSWPPAPCPGPAGPIEVFNLSSPEINVNLASLELNFTGPNNDLPYGVWAIFFINDNPITVDVTSETPMIASQSW